MPAGRTSEAAEGRIGDMMSFIQKYLDAVEAAKTELVSDLRGAIGELQEAGYKDEIHFGNQNVSHISRYNSECWNLRCGKFTHRNTDGNPEECSLNDIPFEDYQQNRLLHVAKEVEAALATLGE